MGDDEDEEKTGVKEEIMKKFKVLTIRNKKLIQNEESWSIWLNNYGYGHKIIKLPCKHDFHVDWVKKWFEKNSSCPKCRKDLNKSD